MPSRLSPALLPEMNDAAGPQSKCLRGRAEACGSAPGRRSSGLGAGHTFPPKLRLAARAPRPPTARSPAHGAAPEMGPCFPHRGHRVHTWKRGVVTVHLSHDSQRAVHWGRAGAARRALPAQDEQEVARDTIMLCPSS